MAQGSATQEETLTAGSSWWDLISRRAERTPDRVMLEDEGGHTLTFDEFRRRAEEVAAGLVEMGVRPDQVVSWQLPTSLRAAVLMAALSRLGVAQNPVIPILRRAEVSQIVDQLESAWLFVPGTWRGFDYAAMAGEVAAGRHCQVVVCDQFDPTEHGLGLPIGDPVRLGPPGPSGPSPLGVADPARWYYYSSGTTAAPKGVRHTDASAMASCQATMDLVRLAADDVFPMAFPITHIGGIMMLTATLRAANRMVLIEAFDPVRSPLFMADRGATLLGSAVPFFLAYLEAQRRHGEGLLFGRLRQVLAGGAPLPPELHLELERELGHGVANSWGLTEFPAATSLAIDDPPEKFLGSAGRPARGVEVRVNGPTGTPVPTGVEGELCLRGPQRFAGYVDSSLDADSVDADGYLRTGDLGMIDEDGFVWITGRLKDVIIRNAENISALEIEGVVYEHPSVADVAVVGVPDRRTGERCCAVVVLAADAPGPLTLADLAEHCRAHGLARQKVPEQLEIVADLPRGPMGKVLKHELRARLTADQPAGSPG
jgi:acyl-CoA synthetase (AMP-forming)/AMP-acid ligase II